ncbi:MAG: hypothetical protein AAF585_24930 [Verrucomicrobiota bacterium]
MPRNKKKQASEIQEKQHTLQARVDALEDFIAGAPARQKAFRMENRNTLPAPEGMRRRVQKKVTLGAQALERRARERRHFFQFMMLLAVWVSVAVWLWFAWLAPR